MKTRFFISLLSPCLICFAASCHRQSGNGEEWRQYSEGQGAIFNYYYQPKNIKTLGNGHLTVWCKVEPAEGHLVEARQFVVKLDKRFNRETKGIEEWTSMLNLMEIDCPGGEFAYVEERNIGKDDTLLNSFVESEPYRWRPIRPYSVQEELAGLVCEQSGNAKEWTLYFVSNDTYFRFSYRPKSTKKLENGHLTVWTKVEAARGHIEEARKQMVKSDPNFRGLEKWTKTVQLIKLDCSGEKSTCVLEDVWGEFGGHEDLLSQFDGSEPYKWQTINSHSANGALFSLLCKSR